MQFHTSNFSNIREQEMKQINMCMSVFKHFNSMKLSISMLRSQSMRKSNIIFHILQILFQLIINLYTSDKDLIDASYKNSIQRIKIHKIFLSLEITDEFIFVPLTDVEFDNKLRHKNKCSCWVIACYKSSLSKKKVQTANFYSEREKETK